MFKSYFLLIVFSVLLQRTFCQDSSKTNTNPDSTKSIKKLTDSLIANSQNTEKISNQIENYSQELINLQKQNDRLHDAYKQDSSNNRAKAQSDKKRLAELTAKIESQNLTLHSLSTRKQQLDHQKDNLTEQVANLETLINSKKAIADSITTKINADAKHDSSINKDLQSAMVQLAKNQDSNEVIGTMQMFDSIKVFKDSGHHLFKLKINKVYINIQEGILREIIVNTDSGYFRNTNFVIDLLRLKRNSKLKLYFEDRNPNQEFRTNQDSFFVYLDNVVSYIPVRSFTDVPYADFNIGLFPPDNKTYTLKENTSLNNYFNVAAFTDIKGLSNYPNGIAQFTADAKFILNTNVSKKSMPILILNYISFHGGLSKFDNQFQGSQIFKKDSVSRLDILQRSTYAVGLKLNLIRLLLSPTPTFLINNTELNVGFNFLGSKIFDTTLKAPDVIDTSFNRITQNELYIEPTTTISRHKNFALSISIPFYWIAVKQNAKLAGIKNLNTESWTAPSINLMYYAKKQQSSKLFFRYVYFVNLKVTTQSFSQIQLGYSVNLTDTWNQK